MLFTKSESMKILLSQVEKISNANVPTMIFGAEGTDVEKELLAKLIHEKSDRKDRPFVLLNCKAYNNSLIMTSEIFGHEKGSFAGAYNKKIGLLEAAQGGTFYFENIHELDLENQKLLLEMIRNSSYSRIGSKNNEYIDLRLIFSTTGQNIKQKIDSGLFLESLYYSINSISLFVPNLKQRKLDILDMMADYLKQLDFLKNNYKFSPEVENILLNHSWDKNTEELMNVCKYISGTSCPNNIITLENLPKQLTCIGEELVSYSPNLNLYDLEKSYILKALEYYKGNKTKAAEALGITIKTLYNKLSEYGIK